MKLITTNDAAERLGVAVQRIHALIRDGRLSAERLSRDYVIREEDLAFVVDRKPGRPKTHFGIFTPDYYTVTASPRWAALTKDERDTKLLAEIERRNVELNDPRALPGTREENLKYARGIINAFEKEGAAEKGAQTFPFEPPAITAKPKAKAGAKKAAKKRGARAK